MALFAVGLVLAIFGCVVLHELGHALTARRFGIGTRDITLFPIGGVARLERIPERPWEEFLIAIAGPAVNGVIAVLLYALLALTNLGSGLREMAWYAETGDFLATLMFANIVLGGFNLLPAFPMDGGRVLRALLSYRLGRLRATEIAAGLGMFMALCLGMWGIFSGQLLLVLLAIFVYFAGQQELAMVRFKDRMTRSNGFFEVFPTSPGQFDGRVGIVRPHFSGFTWDSNSHVWIEWREGKPVHTISVE
jgi:Zn-dependent protease